MLLIDTHRRGVASLVAEVVKDVVDAPWGRIDYDIDARLRRLAGDGRVVADRLAEASDRAVERAVPFHRNHAVELAGDGCGGIGMTMRLLSRAGGSVVATGTAARAGAT